ncbi:MAG: hypothetical protein IJ153_01755 [Clostridia bacterium]|nr:hypothetical protein [Clostridia bacterium]
MSIFDTGNWVQFKPTPGTARPRKGESRITVSANAVTISKEAIAELGNPNRVNFWTSEENGTVIITGNDFNGVKVNKDGMVKVKIKELVDAMLERVILYGSVSEYFDANDKPKHGAYFIAEGEAFKEKDPKDKRKWIKGVKFELKEAKYCQMSLNALEKSHDRLTTLWAERKENEASNHNE